MNKFCGYGQLKPQFFLHLADIVHIRTEMKLTMPTFKIYKSFKNFKIDNYYFSMLNFNDEKILNVRLPIKKSIIIDFTEK